MVGISDGSLPGAPTGEGSPPIICHVDMDCFYAACEQLREPALAGEPVVIGMGYEAEEPHGAVATASYEARDYGIESAMPIRQALEILPRRSDVDEASDDAPSGFYRPVDMEFYREVSQAVRAVLRERADTFEPVSIDEAYLDVSERTSWDGVTGFARELKAEIAQEVGVTASLGVAPTKSAAKVASDHDKPDGLVVVRPGDVQSFFAPLDIEAIHGIGPVTAEDLRDLGIETGGDLAAADLTILEDRFGARGREFYDRARGTDPRPVAPPDDPKSLSRESSTGEPISAFEEKRELIRELAHAVAQRARDKNALYQTVGIKVVTPPFDVHTRDHSLSGPVDDPGLVEAIAVDLLDEFDDTPVRKLGVRVSNLSFSERFQANLESWEGTESVSPREFAPSAGSESESIRQLTLLDFTR